ncbi:hypothetical protein [Butyrivibrio sp. VCB2006]|uniref:hypothetical protein n=1 Tax=Butyrivibrio sp. VCB2006 TaxID=1280679 RepID=UPI0003F85C9C|nr:hypothetical protein [Butyrivibrio sp. VCB2006]
MVLEEASDFVKFMIDINNHYSYEFIHMIDNVIKTGEYPDGISKKERRRIEHIIKVYNSGLAN